MALHYKAELNEKVFFFVLRNLGSLIKEIGWKRVDGQKCLFSFGVGHK